FDHTILPSLCSSPSIAMNVASPKRPRVLGKESIGTQTLRPLSSLIAALLLFDVTALSPLPFGSVGPLPIVLWCIVLAIALGFASTRALDARLFLIIGSVAFPICVYLLFLHDQPPTRPFFSMGVPDPAGRAIGDALKTNARPPLSIVRDQPIFALG